MHAPSIIICTAIATLLAMSNARTASAASAPTPYPPLFGTREVYSQNIGQFYRWSAMLARWTVEQHAARAVCLPGRSSNCEPREWHEMLEHLAPLGLYAKIEAVNAAINRYPYMPAAASSNELNRWETPFEFFWKDGGQCQDYAITKFMLLRAAGVPSEIIRLVVLRDINLGMNHAVTVVYVDGKAFMLDNQMTQVVPVAVVRHYRPYYSINETGWWLHLPSPLPSPLGDLEYQDRAGREDRGSR